MSHDELEAFVSSHEPSSLAYELTAQGEYLDTEPVFQFEFHFVRGHPNTREPARGWRMYVVTMGTPFDIDAVTPFRADLTWEPDVDPVYSRFPAAPTADVQANANFDDEEPNFTEWVELLEQLFEFEDYGAVLQFLNRNFDLVPVLLSASRHIPSFLDVDAELRLEIAFDAEDRSEELFITIRTDLPVEHALARRDRLDSEWWLDIAPAVSGRLNIDFTFD